ncbi:MAG: HAMP domain-containing protein [Spirochaetaceae bacterium]|nr:HAMP domain-containing protein [Spirochaetaceae bacterium]MCF7947154.1 HAMP domain-containing protein [Spirochaetia bacterium]MCF7950019.1 HAMP domain-containing protein [Spirochaetaceae bacterium]
MMRKLTGSLRSRFMLFIGMYGIIVVVILILFFSIHIENIVRRQVKEQAAMVASSLDWAIAPLLNSGSVIDIQRLLENIGSYRQIVAVRIYDWKDKIIASSDYSDIGKHEPIEIVQRVFEGHLLYATNEDYATGLYARAVPIRSSDYLQSQGSNLTHVLYLQSDVTYMQNTLGVLFNGMLAQNVGLIVLMLLTAFIFFTYWVLKPLRLFMEATRHMQKGEYHQKVQISSHDEFETFANMFNSMAEEIEEKRLSLKNYSEKLELMVQERTQELSDSVKKLQKANETILQQEKLASIGQLAAGVAHEINNPVGYIMSNLSTLQEYLQVLTRLCEQEETLEQSVLNEDLPGSKSVISSIRDYKQREDYNFILEDVGPLLKASLSGTKRVRNIIADLKDFARMDEAKLDFCNVNDSIEKALQISWNELKYKSEVVRNFGNIPLIEANQMQLTQVFINMLVNAAQAIESHGTITIATRREENTVAIAISDTGHGMSREDIKRIFDPFFTKKKVGRGTGMGLSISHGIIQRHGGSIQVESEQGKGTTFITRLPIRATEEGDKE